MARIYKRSDRVSIRIGDVTLKLAPLSLDQKANVQQAMLMGKAESDMHQLTRGIALSLKYSIKDISGVEDGDGNSYKLNFEGDVLTDECVDDLMNMSLTDKLVLISTSLARGTLDLTDADGKALEGVEVLQTESAQPKNA